jgi:cell division protein FtsQ
MRKQKKSSRFASINVRASLGPALRVIKIFFASLILIGLVSFYYSNYYKKLKTEIESAKIEIRNKLGLNLENVYLEGQHHTKGEQIIAALMVKIGQPILTVPIKSIKDRLEKIDWVKHAIVERRLPNTLYIGIEERKPIAFWQNASQLYLVDEEGTLIFEENLKPFSNLIILIGDDAPLYASSLLEVLKTDERIFKKVSSAIRIGERRWNIRFENGLEVKLPEENIEQSWQYVIKLCKDKHLLESGITVLDLRLSDKLFITHNQQPENNID